MRRLPPVLTPTLEQRRRRGLLRAKEVNNFAELKREGLSIQAISAIKRFDRKTVRKYVAAPAAFDAAQNWCSTLVIVVFWGCTPDPWTNSMSSRTVWSGTRSRLPGCEPSSWATAWL